MRVSILLSLVSGVLCQFPVVPPDFPQAINNTQLDIFFTNNGTLLDVSPGEELGIDVPASQPSFAINLATPDNLPANASTLLLLTIDPDASYPENPTRRSYLHYLAPGVTFNSTNSSSGAIGLPLSTQSDPFVPYARPAPPTNSSAHRYLFYAFVQPADFGIPESYSAFSAQNRSSFNITDFVVQANLSQPLAGNYFFVSNMSDFSPTAVLPSVSPAFSGISYDPSSAAPSSAISASMST